MEPNNITSDAKTSEDDYFQPLGIMACLGRATHVFRKCWKSLLVTSAAPIFVWYIVAIGIRKVAHQYSASHFEYRSFDMNGDTITYKWESLRTTCSRLGLVVEFFLVFFLFLPADAMNIRTIIAGLYAGDVAVGSTFLPKTAFRAVWPKLPSLGLVCAIWCTILMLPLILIVLYMAPEGQIRQDGIAIYYQPWLPKLVFGLVYLLASSAFMLVTCLTYSILLTVKEGRAMASLNESFELCKKSWSHIGAVTFLWFLIKVVITKIVTAINWWYYLQEKRFWIIWDQPGIPLHPIRILWSTDNDLWEFGRSWISVPFVIFLAAMGSAFQAVLYMDTRIKQEGYTRNLLRKELGLDDDGDGKETTDYKTMENDVPMRSGGTLA